MTDRKFIVLTGGPGGGKTSVIKKMLSDPVWKPQVVGLPEAIFAAQYLGVSPREKLFQRLMVHIQIALEQGVDQALKKEDNRTILCHRGSLDPLAYWLTRGWDENEFMAYTNTTLEQHYNRYHAVIHLVTAADGAEFAYKYWPEAHRQESIEQAIHIVQLLKHTWSKHSNYYLINNHKVDWERKENLVIQIIKKIIANENI